jgi:putative hydrolase of the HAD superfamily
VRAGQRLAEARRPAPSYGELDAVCIDAHGTLVGLRDPVPALVRLLAGRGVRATPDAVRDAFAAEARYYAPRSLQGRDEDSLAALRAECARVFLDALEAPLEAAELAPDYVAALEFEALPGVVDTLRMLRAHGLALVVVANWDVSVHDRLRELGLATYFDAIVASADACVAKPDGRIFEIALDRIGVQADRALHVGDSRADEEGAAAAGLRFAPAPLASAFAEWR